MNNDTLFKIGDKVLVNSSREEGIIKEIVSVLGRGNNAYLVSINNKDRMYTEDNLSLLREKIDLDKVNVNEISLLIEIEDKIDNIIKKLELVRSTDEEIELVNACKVQAYLITMEELEDVSKCITNNVLLDSLYDGFVNSKADFVTYSYMFSEILKRVGMTVLNVGAKDENNEFYITNLVLIGNKYYYFDVNLEREIYLDADNEDINLCCAGLGSDRYYNYFNPLCVLNYNNTGKEMELPKNISKVDLDITVINNLI